MDEYSAFQQAIAEFKNSNTYKNPKVLNQLKASRPGVYAAHAERLRSGELTHPISIEPGVSKQNVGKKVLGAGMIGTGFVLAGIATGLAIWSAKLQLATGLNDQELFASKSGRFFISCAKLEEIASN